MPLLTPRPLHSIAILIAFLLLMACSQKSDDQIPLVDYPITENQSPEFLLAQSLRNNGSFHKADSVYQLLLLKNSNSPQEKAYIHLNQLLCQFAANDTLSIDASFNSPHFKGLSSLVRGIALARKDQSGFEDLYKARMLLQAEGLENSIYCILTLEQLGLAHMQKGSYMDSVSYYYSNAYEAYSRHTQTTGDQVRLLTRMALTSLVHRNEISGIGYIDRAMTLTPTAEEAIALTIYRSTLLRKLLRYDESDIERAKAEKHLSLHLNHSLEFLLYREKAIMGVNRKDSILFKSALLQLDKLEGLVPSLNAHKHRLIGVYYDYLNIRTKEKLEHYEIALNGFKRERAPDTKIIFEALTVLMNGYLSLNDLAKAELYAYEGLVYSTPLAGTTPSFTRAIDPIVQMETYNFINYDVLATIYLRQYQQTSSKKLLQNAFDIYMLIDSLIIEQVRAQEEESVLTFLQIGHGIYSRALQVCHALNTENPNTRWIEAAHLFMERSKSIATHQDILKHDENYFPSVPSSIKKRELELKTKLAIIKRQDLTRSSVQLQEVIVEQDQFFQVLEKNYPDYYLARYSPNLTTASQTISKATQEKKTILNYHLSGNTLFIIRYDQYPEFKAIILPAAFQDSLFQLRHLLSQPSLATTSSFKRLSHTLYKTLIKPFNQLQHQLEIVPEGVLSYLPFEVLISDTTGNFNTLPYLLKKHTINYKFSLKPTTSIPEKPIAKIVGYAYTGDSKQLRALPGAKKEMEIVTDIFTDAHLITRSGNSATRQQFLEDIEAEADLLHISMHATSDPSNRLLNGIHFSSDKGTDTVFGFEIVPKNVKASIVVLTSCDSGFGAIVPGEGTFSLARAFQQTGVHSVIASLWSLPDYSSPILCKTLYTEIKAGSSPAHALTQAKLQYLNNADKNLSNPFFWAGLISY